MRYQDGVYTSDAKQVKSFRLSKAAADLLKSVSEARRSKERFPWRHTHSEGSIVEGLILAHLKPEKVKAVKTK